MVVLENSFNPKYVFQSCQGVLEIYYGVHYSKKDLLADAYEKDETRTSPLLNISSEVSEEH